MKTTLIPKNEKIDDVTSGTIPIVVMQRRNRPMLRNNDVVNAGVRIDRRAIMVLTEHIKTAIEMYSDSKGQKGNYS
ncbi:hypothetical protein [Prevotella sp. 10(H)]|uniref:hypothetical protein n=1 Tax=Prevotella sp. 10(H) TaxID=1158294 RepID=UPI0004A738E6|nr:hypothetical protein [Prevotella sp. 10(H)]